jgi:hypothetical protein
MMPRCAGQLRRSGCHSGYMDSHSLPLLVVVFPSGLTWQAIRCDSSLVASSARNGSAQMIQPHGIAANATAGGEQNRNTRCQASIQLFKKKYIDTL